MAAFAVMFTEAFRKLSRKNSPLFPLRLASAYMVFLPRISGIFTTIFTFYGGLVSAFCR